MRDEMVDWLIQQLKEEKDNHGGEYMLFAVKKDALEVTTSLNCSEALLLTCIKELTRLVSAEGLTDMVMEQIRERFINEGENR